MIKERVAVYFDGFNLYHAISDLKAPYLKWVNLQRLSQLLIMKNSQELVKVAYFSAKATFFQNTPHESKIRRHEAYIRALEAKGVECHLGNFAKRDLFYNGKGYKAKWQRREEKQTDVAIAVHVTRDACFDVYDRALIVSCDTDMLPLFRVIKKDFAQKILITVAPPNRTHHRDLLNLADDHLVIKRSQVERALFGAKIVSNGKTVSYRPNSYKP
ncbi:MAG: NYN domain-containing protein [Pseudomonadota bacterium]|nr:NYN domain-containing protein [Pseudomonadota bacterium]